MRLSRTLLIVLSLLIAASAMAIAADPTPRPKRPAARQGRQAPPADQRPDWWGKDPNAARNAFSGKVESITATSIAVAGKDGVKSFVINEQTRVMVHGQKATVADIHTGDNVAVRFQPGEGNVLTAVGIMLPKPRLAGEIAAVQGNSIVLTGKDGVRHSATVNQRTRYRAQSYVGTIADLRVGYKATIGGEQANGAFVAQDVAFVPAMARGTVTARSGNSITVKTVQQAELQLAASAATAVTVRPRVADNRKGTLADIAVGTPVNVGYHATETGPAPLLWVGVLTGQ